MEPTIEANAEVRQALAGLREALGGDQEAVEMALVSELVRARFDVIVANARADELVKKFSSKPRLVT
jgi:hypothetical protein